MSVNRLVTEAVQRVNPLAAAKAATAPVPPVGGAADGTVSNALTALVRYVPTEVVIIYIAAVAALPQFKQVFSGFTPAWIYWGFICLTPLMFALLFYNRLAVTAQAFPSWQQYPWWKTIASTIAFAVWALAVPNNPYFQGTGESALAGLAALLVSTMLTLIEPIVERK